MLAAVAEPYLSLHQAARRIGLGAHALQTRIIRGELPAIVMGGRVFVKEADLDRLTIGEAAKAG